jgi:predicted alpha/beta hydrolase
MPSIRITTADDTVLHAHHFVAADGGSRGAMIVLCGVGSVQSRYWSFARHMARSGWHVVTFDYRGVGRSRAAGVARERVSMSAWGEQDLDAVIGWIQTRLAPAKMVAVGHSIGGQLLCLAPRAQLIDAAVCVAAQRGNWRHWTGVRRLILLALWYVYIPVLSRVLAWVPLPGGRAWLASAAARDWARWGRSDDYRRACGFAMRPRFAEFCAPMLFLSFDDDRLFAPRSAVDALAREYYVAAPRIRLHIEPNLVGLGRVGHSGLFDVHSAAPRLWGLLSDWLYNQCHIQRSDFPATLVERDLPALQRELNAGCSPARCVCSAADRAARGSSELSKLSHATPS